MRGARGENIFRKRQFKKFFYVFNKLWKNAQPGYCRIPRLGFHHFPFPVDFCRFDFPPVPNQFATLRFPHHLSIVRGQSFQQSPSKLRSSFNFMWWYNANMNSIMYHEKLFFAKNVFSSLGFFILAKYLYLVYSNKKQRYKICRILFLNRRKYLNI